METGCGWVLVEWVGRGLCRLAVSLGWILYVLLFQGFVEGWKPSTIYYSTKVRFCDKVAENLIFVCRDFCGGRQVLGG